MRRSFPCTCPTRRRPTSARLSRKRCARAPSSRHRVVSKEDALRRFKQNFGALAEAAGDLAANPLPASVEVRLRPNANPAAGRVARAEGCGARRRRRRALRPPMDSAADARRRRRPRWRLRARGAARVCGRADGGQRRPARACSPGAKRFTSCSSSARRSPTSAVRSSSRD